MRRLPLLLAAASALALGGCAALSTLAASAFEKPRLTFRSVALQGLDLEGATLGFTFDLENPNAVGLRVARLGYAIEAAGTQVATGDLPGGLTIPANGTAPVTFPARVRFRDVPGIVGLFGRQGALPYALSGTVGVETPIGVVELPLSYSDRIALPRLPSFELTGLRIRSLSFQDVGLEVLVRVRNANPFPIPAGSLDWAIQVGGSAVVRGEDRALAAVRPGGEANIALPLRLDLAEVGRAAQAITGGGPVDVRLDGTADVGGLPIPLGLSGRIPAHR